MRLVDDLRYALRTFRKSPGFSLLAIATLALAIGANTAVFSLVDTVLLRPFPFPDPDKLVFVWEDAPFFGLKDSPPAMGNYVDWRAQNHVFEEMGGLETRSYQLTGEGEPEQLSGSIVTASLFRTLGVRPMLGREFLDSEDTPGTAYVALLSHGLWQRRFGADPHIAGKTIRLNGARYEVIGVMPPEFRFPSRDNDIWAPIGASFKPDEFTNRGRHNLMVVARLKRGVSLRQANADIQTIARRLQSEYPRTNARVGAFVAPLRDHFAGGIRQLAAVLLAAVACVLLIGCANVANLLLARTLKRSREIAVRTALGAGRMRIAGQLLVESLLLAMSGGILGALLSTWSFRTLAALVPSGVPGTLHLDYRVLAFAFALSVFTSLLFGLAPAMAASRSELNEVLKQGGRGAVGGGGKRLWRGALVVVEVALTLVLLTGAGLLIRTFAALRGVDPGFRTKNILTVGLPVSFARYGEPSKKIAFYEGVLERVKSLPGVVSAGITIGIPIDFKGWVSGFTIDGKVNPGNQLFTANYRLVSADYLNTMGIPLRQGRYLDGRDVRDSAPVALVNEAMARKFWPGENAVGKRFRFATEAPWIAIVGIIGDVKQAGLDVPAKPELYCPYQQQDSLPRALAIRTAGAPSGLAAAVRREIRAIDPDLPVAIRTMEEILDREVSQRKLQTALLGAFAALALLLASLGIYGVLSFSVAQRTHEIAVRMALGARPSSVLRSVVCQGLALALAGMLIGAAGAIALGRAMSSLLFGVGPMDPLNFLSVAALLLLVAAVAGYIPARRAMKVDPLIALRYE